MTALKHNKRNGENKTPFREMMCTAKPRVLYAIFIALLYATPSFFFIYACSTNSTSTGPSTPQTTSSNSIHHYLVDTVGTYDFGINTNYQPLNKILEEMSFDPNSKSTIKKEYCCGDCCITYKKVNNGQRTLYLFKSNGGEYGYGNTQFLFKDSSLVMTRSFDFSVRDFPTDSTPTVFSISEEIIDFSGTDLFFKTRHKISKDPSDHNVDEISFRDSTANKAALMARQIETFKKLLEIEKCQGEE